MGFHATIWVGLTLLLITLPIVFARRTFPRETSWPKLHRLLSILLPASLICFILSYHLDEEYPRHPFLPFHEFIGISIVIALILLGFSALTALIGRPPHRLRREIIAKKLIPSYLCSLIILGFLSKAYYLEEQHWVSQDHLTSPEGPYRTKADAIVTEAARAELLEMLPKHSDEQ